jgi:nitroreductase
MEEHPVLDLLMRRASIREYTEEVPSDERIEAIVRAGQQAPFAAQLGSVLLSRDRKRHPFGAPLMFTVLVDIHRLETLLARRGWHWVTSDAASLLFGIQDACYMAQAMVIAADALGLGSCYLGGTAFRAAQLAESLRLPPRVFPLVQLVMGYPAEAPPPRPRYPLRFSLYEGRYPSWSDEELEAAARVMDEGYLAQDYYRRRGAKIPLTRGEETVSDEAYSWVEHMGRKWGQWLSDPEELLGSLWACGFEPEVQETAE